LRILAVDSSAKTAGVAICDDDKLVGEFFIDNGLTHSQTLMPMIQSCIDLSGVSLSSLDAYAVSIGPGSFTGLRIGIACVKELPRYQKNHATVFPHSKQSPTEQRCKTLRYVFDGCAMPTGLCGCFQYTKRCYYTDT
jgi:tRNA A37 threonylcarbamoyltransferase TsaD